VKIAESRRKDEEILRKGKIRDMEGFFCYYLFTAVTSQFSYMGGYKAIKLKKQILILS
jgi:hypothetical protein